MAYAKLQILNSRDCYITKLPFTIGSSEDCDLCIPCKKVHSIHCCVSYNASQFHLKAYQNTLIVHSGNISADDPAMTLKDFACFVISCDYHNSHVFYFMLPVFSFPVLDPPGLAPIPDTEDTISLECFPSKQPDSNLMKKWSMNDRENLKKWLLTYGYGRWKKLKEVMSEADSIQKPIPELRSFATSLVRTIAENLPMEKYELKKTLVNMIEETDEDFYVPPKIKDWGIMARQRAVPWGKRIYMLYRIKFLIKKFKEKYNGSQLKWGNLLNFMSSANFYGQRPSAWWTRRHDIDLIRGTHKHGYANYTQMRNDPSLSFSAIDTDSTFKEFPSADTITRRLKKLMISIDRIEEFEFDKEQQLFEPTDWTPNEKKTLLKLITDFGVPLNLEGKNDWNQLKDKFDLILANDKPINSFERMVQHLRMLAQHTLNPEEGETDVKDADSYKMTTEESENLQNSLNKLQFIRKHILKNGSEFFNAELAELENFTKKNSENFEPWASDFWKCEVHDRGLLNAVADNGLSFLSQISNNSQYSFLGISINIDQSLQRVHQLCEFFRNISNMQKNSKKNESKKKKQIEEYSYDENGQMKTSNVMKKIKVSKFNVPRDNEGNIIYPIVINNSLTILNLGEIDLSRPNYQSGRNIFPIGFKSIREHSSIFHAKERIEYLCEILDGGAKPLFRVTPMQDRQPLEEHAILKDSCTGCWIIICNRVNELQKSRRSKVTVSGTDRFGLWDTNVVKLIHELPGAEYLAKI
jgi:F/Y-rich N-terminus/F/Y rich C-terminus